MKQQSRAKQLVIEFIKTTPLEGEFTFETEPPLLQMSSIGKEPQEQGRIMVQRMRTELSRLRHKVIAMGRIPQPFKMLLVKIETLEDGRQRVTLKKTQTPSQALAEDLVQLMDQMSIGRSREREQEQEQEGT